MPRFDVATIGEGQLRYCVPAGTRLESAPAYTVHACGTEANVTALLSRLGWKCGWFSSLPDSPLGRRVANEFRLSGLDLSAVLWRETGRLATYYVEYAVPPRTTQVYYDRANSCFAQLTAADIDWDYLTDARILHLSGITIPLSAELRQIVPEAIRRAKDKGAKISLDVNYRSRIWTEKDARQTLLPILRDVDILFCGRSDAKAVFGIEGAPAAIIQQLGDLTPAGHIVTSLSGEGLIGWDRNEIYLEEAAKVTIVDRIGAGDAMVAGALDGILSGDFAKGIRQGALTAALALSQHGDIVITTRAELDQLLSQQPNSDICR